MTPELVQYFPRNVRYYSSHITYVFYHKFFHLYSTFNIVYSYCDQKQPAQDHLQPLLILQTRESEKL